MAAFGSVTLGCALFFPDRKEELQPELWAVTEEEITVGVAAAE
jgi:hypothetical protein